MAVNKKDLINIDFGNQWKCYCQISSDEIDEKTIVSTANNLISYQYWSAVELPHIIDHTKPFCKWWYYKQFDWTPTNQQSEQRLDLHFEPLNNHHMKCNINAMIWLNSTQIFSGLLTTLQTSVELPSALLQHENEQRNILVICCINTSNVRRFDSLDPRLKKSEVISHDRNLKRTHFLSSFLNSITHFSLRN